MRAVITFHAIDDGPPPLSFPPQLFRRLVAALRANDIPILGLDELLQPGARGVALTFDDGMTSLAQNAAPVLKDFDAPAHLFLTTATAGGDNRWPGQPASAPLYQMMSWPQIEALPAAGVMIEAHTATHPDLRKLSDGQVEAEMEDADLTISARLGRAPRFFAYPYGYHDARIRKLAGRRYKACVTTELRYVDENARADAIPRLDSHYLRHTELTGDLAGPAARAYLEVRRLMRRLRGRG
ncbi:polysaccharide deacetylase family protein [Phenylobacterium sp.]|uniref:polysaccharide deacetylase family protein n=1 Tax=Phenylobacterium sp. TaxID=1871053 RepID=UPI0027346A46|nr:polysaccharide deacetylase family protein [Phenylobacterium sp.]MDP3659122.1 polysaccharide deacetylase family protein [Phenylobacterium sp.]